jgi:hypothetical protein
MKEMIAERCRILTSSSGGSRAGQPSMRWDSTKNWLYEIVNGEYPAGMKERNKRKLFLQIDLTEFKYEILDATDLLNIYETIVRRFNVCM